MSDTAVEEPTTGSYRIPPDWKANLEARMRRIELINWVAIALGLLEKAKPYLHFFGG